MEVNVSCFPTSHRFDAAALLCMNATRVINALCGSKGYHADQRGKGSTGGVQACAVL